MVFGVVIKEVMQITEVKHFIAFMQDLLRKTLRSSEIEWEPKEPMGYSHSRRRRRRAFENLPPRVSLSLRNAVLRVRNRLKVAFSLEITQAGGRIFTSSSNLSEFVEYHYRRYFRQPDVDRSLIISSAFTVDLALHCFQIGKGDLVEVILVCLNDLWISHLKHRFDMYLQDDLWMQL